MCQHFHLRHILSCGHQVVELQAKQTRYEDNLLFINGLWGELNRDILVLASRVDASISSVPDPQAAELDAKSLASAPDPFIQRLV